MIVRVPFAVYVLAAAFGLNAGDRAPARALRDATPVGVPRATGAIELDGRLSEAIWLGAATRTAIGARPFSEARFAWGGDTLFVAFYAADSDIVTRAQRADDPVWLDDAFRLTFSTEAGEKRVIDVSPSGVVCDAKSQGDAFDPGWQSGATVGHDVDGTPNDARDEDEEWVLELALPLRSLGLAPSAGSRTELALRRCDASSAPGPAPRAPACAEWRGELVLE
jgi:hypothetical protein